MGVVLALSIAYAVLTALGLLATRRGIRRLDGRRLLRSWPKILAAGAAMYAVARAGTALLGDGSTFGERLLVLVAVGGASLAVYVAVAFLLGTEELKSVAALLRRRRIVQG